jgi:hypothetical protein
LPFLYEKIYVQYEVNLFHILLDFII